MSAKPAKKIKIKQIRSGIGFEKSQKATLRALGLERIGRVVEHPDNPAIRGMVATIPHLVVVVKE